MKPVSDDLLHVFAQVAATLIGLVLVGMFFYLESGLRELTAMRRPAKDYLRATTKVILAMYGHVLVTSVALVAAEPGWARAIFAILGLYILVVTGEWTVRSRLLRTVIRVRRTSPSAAWPLVIAPVVLPWLLDGWAPGRESLTLGILLVAAFAFVNTGGLLMAAFDLKDLEAAALSGGGEGPLAAEETTSVAPDQTSVPEELEARTPVGRLRLQGRRPG